MVLGGKKSEKLISGMYFCSVFIAEALKDLLMVTGGL